MNYLTRNPHPFFSVMIRKSNPRGRTIYIGILTNGPADPENKKGLFFRLMHG